MPEYRIRIPLSHAEVRCTEGMSNVGAEYAICRAAFAVAEALRGLGYNACTSGHPPDDGFDGRVLTGRPLDASTKRSLQQTVFSEFAYPLEIEELPEGAV